MQQVKNIVSVYPSSMPIHAGIILLVEDSLPKSNRQYVNKDITIFISLNSWNICVSIMVTFRIGIEKEVTLMTA